MLNYHVASPHHQVASLRFLNNFVVTNFLSAEADSRSKLKMASSIWKGLVGIGLFALAHAAFSAAQRE